MIGSAAKVLLVGGFPPPYGGIAVHVAALRERLAAEGVASRVIDLGARRRKAPGVVPVAGPAGLALQLAAHAAGGWRIHLHTSGHTPKSWAIAAAVAAARRPFGPAPLLTLHSGLLPAWLALGESQRRLTRTVCRGFGRILAVSPEIARALREVGVEPWRLTVVPAFTGDALPGRAPPGFGAVRARHRPLISAALSVSPIYGTRLLLEALPAIARTMPGLGLALFGPASAAEVHRLALRYGVEGRVAFLGELSHGEALAVIAASDLFVRSTLADGDSLAVREALALGTPVAASAVGFRPPGTGLFRVCDSLDLALRAEQMLLDGARPAPALPDREAVAAVLDCYRRLWGGDGEPAVPGAA